MGLIQILRREVNNARYQGVTQADGSTWIRLDIPTVRKPSGPCHDSGLGSIGQGKSGALFWNKSEPVICGRPVELVYEDWPQDSYPTIITNLFTKQPNYLQELHVALDFTTALMLMRPNKSLQTLHWVRWNEAWDYTFDTIPSGEPRIRRGIALVGTVEFAIAMPAPPELPTRFALPAKNCNTIGYEASNNPARIQPSRTW